MPLIYLLGFLYIGAAIYLANHADARRAAGQSAESRLQDTISDSVRYLRLLLYGLAGLTVLSGLLVLQQAFIGQLEGPLPAELAELPKVDMAGAVVNLALAGAASSFAIAVVASPKARQWVKRVIGRYGDYDPDSYVHLTALALALAVLSGTISTLVAGGGLSGLARSLEESGGISSGELMFIAGLQVTVSLLGVGLSIRRTLAECLLRLGIRWPTRMDITQGVGTGVSLYVLQFVIGLVWAAMVTPEQLQEQIAASEQLVQGFDTVPLALLLAFTTGVGEEALFRGAMQPVFGLLPTTIYFALLHTQYTLTPATLIIVVVGLGLGWLRQRQSTTAAIIAHFVYNFIPLILRIWLGEMLTGI